MIEQAQKIGDELVRLRRDIHQHPELGFEEVRTAALVADTLREIGMDVQEGVGQTGVVGQIGTGEGPTIGIRADMDALPIQQQTDVPYKSVNDGVMHACGHDAHTAMLLGAAHLLKQSFATEKWQGNVRFLFQPCEEKFDENGVSGATAMIDDAALEQVDAVIALHVASNAPAGQIRFWDNYALAAVDELEFWLRGDGGHGAYPHTGSDPVHMLGQILNALYAIPSRYVNPLNPCVISIGQVHAGNAHNVIPGEVYVNGTIRSFDEGTRHLLWEEIERALKLSELMDGSYELKIHKGYPAPFNDVRVNDWMRAVARDLVGETAVVDEPFGMAGEDFAYMSQKAPGAMFMLGAATPDGIVRNHHTDIFDIDESILPTGAAILAETARRFVLGELQLD
ncbi:MAG: M20 family metallopeptidase [Chloroflexota bacterium]